MNIDTLKADLLKSFPDIINIHDFHVWQLTTSKVVITVHIVFLNPMVSFIPFLFKVKFYIYAIFLIF